MSKEKTTTTKKRSTRSRTNRVIKRNVGKKILANNFLIALFLIVILLSASYFLLSNSLKENSTIIQDIKKEITLKNYSNEEIMDEVLLSEGIKEEVKLIEDSKKLLEQAKKEEPKVKEIIIKNEVQEEIIYEDKKKIDDKKVVTKKDKYTPKNNQKPKLVIVIDDVVSKSQVNKILDIGYPVNISFLPPAKNHKNSANIAKDINFYMIHFPLQASKAFKNFEENTLNIADSYQKIETRVKQLRAWYPNAIYTNNHTGSVFTENYEAMDKLFRALKKHNFIFVDSRTSPNSVAKELSVKYKFPYIVRDVFLDNNRNYDDILKQLKESISIAKKQGFAIAIGHPYDITFKVLKESKELLKDVEPIFLDKLPYL
ncbi:divergent polysaccharide deacetylase family protein [Arcobacter porcinus]|uniref:Divergent polysaccharide deacetylase n=1 Tax=Arcobacter porcinus TaxID=1935204 RepID=A0A5C2HEU2_9BACT|nr:divergent polysaccharide deacetylase family protein [Arcobacter porcinus]OCL88120.1 Divergent polysaccharide deacetylase [Arcobacter porcinus]OCL94562.1 Divergent polysaccharide deacetylase [Aliarcobacter thereius]QEP41446.1 divergent polysaccharide deacetylase [Arcobacter porcinus]